MTRRRQFIKTIGAGVAATALPVVYTKGKRPVDTVKLGVASYSLRKLSRQDTIDTVKALGTPFINLKSFHQEYEQSPAQLREGKKVFEDAGLMVIGGGTITFREDDDDDIRQYFEYAKHSGMPLMVSSVLPAALPRIEKFVKEYDIMVAIHNHGPEDKWWPAPSDVVAAVSDLDPRIGCCVDVGHTTRTGKDVMEEIRGCGARLLDMHMKDLADLNVKESQVIVGKGAMPVADIFSTLMEMGYEGYVNLEYEIDADDPRAGMHQSFAYMRGVLDGLSA